MAMISSRVFPALLPITANTICSPPFIICFSTPSNRGKVRTSFARLEQCIFIAIEVLEDRLHAKGSWLRSLNKGHTTFLQLLIRPLAVICRQDGSRIFPDQVREPRSQDHL